MERSRRKKGGEGKKTIVALSGFILLRWPKQLLNERGLFGGNIFKNPARYNDACIKNIKIVVTS